MTRHPTASYSTNPIGRHNSILIMKLMNYRKFIIATFLLSMLVPCAAHGATVSELQQQIAALELQLAQLIHPGSIAPTVPTQCIGFTFSRTLSLGSSGQDVACLQAVL